MVKDKIKSLVTAYQAKRLDKQRKAENKKQLQLIYKGLIERGY